MAFVQLAFHLLPDQQLLTEVQRLAGCERQVTAQLIASLMELDARRLYLGEGCSSLFTYCTQVLHLSEHAAYGRIEAARAARRFPKILEHLADGSLTLTSVCLLAPHLTDDNHAQALNDACHKSKRNVELIVARLRPLPAVPTTVRKCPAPTPAANSYLLLSDASVDRASPPIAVPPPVQTLPPPPPAVVKPLAPERYKVQFTVTAEAHTKLRRAQDLLRHQVPDGDIAAVVDRALTLLVADLERKKLAQTDRPRESRQPMIASRHIPAAVKRAVWARDGGQCAFVGRLGRCTERGFLEFHHVVPYAHGGEATVENTQLRCRTHNAYEAQLDFGGVFARSG